ncbi:hypothetical protein EA300_24610 [Escherichia coli]|nr:hypothetical protein EA300_24610 [Escherichia coli]
MCIENPQLGWGFRKAFSFEPVIKTPFDLLKHLAVWQLQVSNKKSEWKSVRILEAECCADHIHMLQCLSKLSENV